MKKAFLCDNHIHSKCSFDGCEKVFDLCTCARKKRLDTITITDHFDCFPGMDEKEMITNFSGMLNDIYEIKGKFENDLQLLTGIELGEISDNLFCANRVLEKFKFDFILLSLHNLPDKDDFYYLTDFSKKNVYALLEEYFDKMLEIVEFENFDSLAHLTYPLRYIIPNINFKLDISHFDGEINEILSKLAQKNKALEINSSGLRQPIKDTLPGKDIIERFKNAGGKYITIGSDAHKCVDMGKGIKEAMLVVYDAGFDSITVFEGHKPVLHKIEL